ncbi:MAG: DotU family type IV/VI secretion system protein [Planctomycetes bacterium]|nr:DotU family type IV/VI secretion system protein [Planctomycetota bacterium]
MREIDLDSPLLELSEPVFATVCEVRSEDGENATPEVAERLIGVLALTETRARVHPELLRNFESIRHDLYFFVDHALSRRFPDWRSLAADRLGIVAGDAIFCRDLDEMLEEPEERRDELGVMRTCIDLGFDGADVVGPKPWRRSLAALARAVPAKPPTFQASTPVPRDGRRGPTRRKWWPILFFAWLSLTLLGLAAWQLWRAPVSYRQRLARLHQTAAAFGRTAARVPGDGTVRK